MKNVYTERSRSGFTLIELLITISIIAVLAAIGFVSYTTVLKSGRDSKRQSDLRSIQSALEQYHNDQGFYPTDPGMNILNADPPVAFTSSTGNPSPPATVKIYLNSPPKDPLGSPRYCYLPSPRTACDNSPTDRCTGYSLYAKLENGPTSPTYTCGGATTYNFRVTPP